MTGSVECNIHDQVATITLNRPEYRNAFNAEMIAQFTQYLYDCQHQDSIKILVIKGSGEHFCAGADLKWMQETQKQSREENKRDALNLAKLFYTLYHFNKPVIALVQGSVYGGGLGLVACSDIVIAEKETKFCFSEVKLGLVPAVIGPYVVSAIGERAAKKYMLTAEVFNASQAEKLGLVHEIVVTAEMALRLEYFLGLLKQNAPNALKITKQMLHNLNEYKNHHHNMEYTAEVIAQVRVDAEAREGMSAFLGKKTPSWQT